MTEATQTVESAKVKRGRKPGGESRAASIRARLVTWRRDPESQRVSLRALAAELGTSHQLLSFYLRGLDDWQRKDYERQAGEIRDQADAENRLMTPWEESQVRSLEREAYLLMIDSVLQPTLKRLEAGTLSGRELKVVNFLAQRGVPIAQKILEKHRNNLPAQPAITAKSFRTDSANVATPLKRPSHAVS